MQTSFFLSRSASKIARSLPIYPHQYDRPPLISSSTLMSTPSIHSTTTPSRVDSESRGFPTRHFHASQNVFSENLLGYSPMARPVPSSFQQVESPSRSNPGPVWGTDSNTVGGGVWAQTSAKKEKLNELLTELNASGVDTGTKGMQSLDDAANAQDKLDLELADGLKLIAKYVDQGTMVEKSVAQTLPDVGGAASEAVENSTKQMFRLLEATENNKQMEKAKFDATIHETIRILSTALPPDSKLKKPVAGSLDPRHPLCYLREFVEDSEERADNDLDYQSSGGRELEFQIDKFNAIITQAFSSSTQLYRALLLRATAQTLIENWDAITSVTSGDIDRAAVSKSAIPSQRNSVKTEHIKKLFEAYDNKPCTEWVQSWWILIDHDGDGFIDEEEMNKCVELAMKPVHMALSELMYMTLGVCPVRTVGVESNYSDAWFLGGSKFLDVSTTAENYSESKKISWRNRRQELKARNELTKTFQATLAHHFRDQAEMPHRLRCIYAWADKSHQNNKIDSIIVDGNDEWGAASSIVGRKRYVELLPKISYPEFRKEQARHFPHLDKIGEEIAMSFKEDLWVLQGKRRQNKELRRDSLLFLLGVSLVDFGIGML